MDGYSSNRRTSAGDTTMTNLQTARLALNLANDRRREALENLANGGRNWALSELEAADAACEAALDRWAEARQAELDNQ